MRYFFISLFFINSLFSQRSDEMSDPVEPAPPCHPSENMISINPFAMLPVSNVNFYNLSYVRKLDCSSAFGIELRYPVPQGIEGYGVGIEYRWYPQKYAMKKFYIAPRLSYISVSDELSEAQVFSYGVLGAYQFFIGDHFGVGMGFGIEYNTGPQLQEAELVEGQSNVTPHFRLDFGWSW